MIEIEHDEHTRTTFKLPSAQMRARGDSCWGTIEVAVRGSRVRMEEQRPFTQPSSL